MLSLHRFMRSTALTLALGFFLPAPGPVTGLVFNPAAYADPVTGAIPPWIKAACCGAQDAHRLRADQVYQDAKGDWHVEGYAAPIPNDQAHASQDAYYWAFYRDDYVCNGGTCIQPRTAQTQSGIYCFFVPMEF